jgi:hypothetical protein
MPFFSATSTELACVRARVFCERYCELRLHCSDIKEQVLWGELSEHRCFECFRRSTSALIRYESSQQDWTT